MTELETIQSIPTPRTRDSLTADLRALGVKSGMIVLVHSSLSSIGWVNGGSVAVVQALLDVITCDG
ncbi:MAG: aminoglycoside N(3)-acetyltransferase, partial [Chloroflexi bacterium]|nr:aminoglycoside N(3)-acetyltransferase [Chloroflexota bacterium]